MYATPSKVIGMELVEIAARSQWIIVTIHFGSTAIAVLHHQTERRRVHL